VREGVTSPRDLLPLLPRPRRLRKWGSRDTPAHSFRKHPDPTPASIPTTPVLLPKSIYESFCRVAEYRELFGKFIIKKDMLLGQVLFALVSVVELDSELI
jgi:hypothetical protein